MEKKCNHELYDTWRGMKKRCYDKNHTYYKNYGGRGIKVCDRWLNSFENFYEDVGDRPSKFHTLDRKDNNGDYTPENCRWATKEEQECNKINCKYIEFNGKSQTLYQWAKELGVNKGTLKGRIHDGWTIEETLTRPVRFRSK